jgi:hypothetical protein
MLVVAKRSYKKVHVVGGAGIFDSIAGFLKRLLTSNAAKQIASTAVKEIGSVAKDKAIDVGKRLLNKVLTPAPVRQEPITQETKVILARLLDRNPGMTGGAIRIQDLVKRLNGGGLKMA